MIAVNAFLISLSKTILKIAIGKALEKLLPKIFEKVDARIPLALYNGASPAIVRFEIEAAIRQVTGKNVSQDVIDVVTMLYDPIQNAVRTQHRPK